MAESFPKQVADIKTQSREVRRELQGTSYAQKEEQHKIKTKANKSKIKLVFNLWKTKDKEDHEQAGVQ